MKSVYFINKGLLVSFIILFVNFSNVYSQTENSNGELKLNSNFNSQSPEYIDSLLTHAKNLIRTNPDSTSILLKKAYDLSIKTKYNAGESRALSTYGYYYFENGEVEKAYEHNMNALKIATQYNLGKEKLTALNNMALDYTLQGEEAKALTKFLEALTVAKEIEDIDMMVGLNVNIANLYSTNGDFETSLTFLEIAKKLNKEHNKDEIFAYAVLNMASVYSQIGNNEEALSLVDKSIDFFEKEKSIDWLSHAYEFKSSVLIKQEKYKEALVLLKKSEKLCDEIDFKFGYTSVYNNLSLCYLELDNLKLAEEYALKCLAISTELNISSVIKEANLILSKTYHEKGNDKLAYEYQAKYQKLYEEASKEKFKKGLGILRSKMKYENEKAQLIKDQNKAIAKQKNYVYLAIVAFLIVCLILALLYRTSKLQAKHTKELQQKQKVLLQHEAELSESNNTKNKLFSIIAHDLKGPINSFLLLMKMSLDETISIDEFKALFPKAIHDIQGISDMLNNLLVWANSQMEGITLKQVNIDIYKNATKTISLLEPIAKKKEINIINKIQKNTISFSDRNHLNIIIRNLISNAIKFTNIEGEIKINSIENEDSIQIQISDNGIGMDEETLVNLFERKHMKSTYGTNNEKGTGLGLSICKEMVESNGGKIWAKSIVTEGTSIYFTVPKKMNSVA
ncbi:tetratricopeptide repeat-containing sensor histidine kinase [Cellulophaga baltica]|uniref:tetratricopeptide repeat-containing sensor histidine kinase n=1 Tax=Cellulophaga TaxID=104264 RepID=UPI001C07C896|nr:MULTISPECIES: tetratricopeptide repeat-containing sensor histidine kinase [Cellulophaga]MBU2996314.1 tetratricopeptide repeat-containing sensor histidine kinase [Cellulophaga baltica]MDO6767709.1 tetratricopeptide repeat-containing sensor histidine kinase [Cellulophaga sp. 1_MG-2023]